MSRVINQITQDRLKAAPRSLGLAIDIGGLIMLSSHLWYHEGAVRCPPDEAMTRRSGNPGGHPLSRPADARASAQAAARATRQRAEPADPH